MSTTESGIETGLRVLAADEDRAALEETARLLGGLGHRVTAYAVGVDEAAERIATEDPDLSVVVLDDDAEHALELVDELSEYAAGPVIVLCNADPSFVSAAAERGIDAFAHPASAEAIQSAIEVAVRRHAERRALIEQVDQLESALARRAVIERAKGILMERHGVGDREAFERLRGHARSRGQTALAVAQAVVDGHALLPKG